MKVIKKGIFLMGLIVMVSCQSLYRPTGSYNKHKPNNYMVSHQSKKNKTFKRSTRGIGDKFLFNGGQ